MDDYQDLFDFTEYEFAKLGLREIHNQAVEQIASRDLHSFKTYLEKTTSLLEKSTIATEKSQKLHLLIKDLIKEI